MRSFKLQILGIATLMAAGQAALGQPKPMPPDPYDPKPASGESQASPAVYPAKNDFPSVEVQAIPPAHARMVELRWTMEQARRSLMNTVDNIREDFEASSELQAAVRSQQLAHDRYVAARNTALKDVRRDPRYTTLRTMAKELKDRIEQLQADDAKGNADAIRGFADLRLEYSTKATGMEVDALIADSRFQEARQKLMDAAMHTQQLRVAFNRSIRRNPEFVAAKGVFSNLTVAYLASDAYLQSAYDARDIALRYAYMLHYWDQYRYSTAYPYYGGYAYGNPYVYNAGYYRNSYSPYYHR